MYRQALLLAVLLLSSGCSTLDKIAKVVMNPDIQVGSNQHQPSQVSFSLLAEPDVNEQGISGGGYSDDQYNTDESDNRSEEKAYSSGTPVGLQLVMLAEDSRFLAMDHDQATADIKQALGKNYLDHQDYTLLPGQFKYLPAVKLASDVHYIGVIVHYADPDASQWRRVVKVKNTGRAYQVLVHLYASEVELKLEEE